VGGYDDWLRQRQPAEATPKPKTVEKQPLPTKTRARKLSFKEQRELETLPARIEELESEQHTLVEKMADPAFYQGDGSATVQAKARLEVLENELATAFARWEELLEIESQAQNG
jgi:ATP-binding cassette subfamily F protein uup